MCATRPPGRLQHLLWAMERAHRSANAGGSTVPLPIVTSPSSANPGPSMPGARFSLQIAGSATEALRPLEKKFRAGPARLGERREDFLDRLVLVPGGRRRHQDRRV